MRNTIKIVSYILIFLIFINIISNNVYYRFEKDTSTSIIASDVYLEEGTAGASFVYPNGTSAVSQVDSYATTFYPNDYNATHGLYDSGSTPSSVNQIDSDYFTVNSSGSHTSNLVYHPTSFTLLNDTSTSLEWGITSTSFTQVSTHTNYRYMGGTSPDIPNMKVTKLYIRMSGSGTVAIALYTGGTLGNPTGAVKRTEAYNVAVSAGWNEIDVPDYQWAANTVTWIGWAHNSGIYYSSSSSDAGDFQTIRGRWAQTNPGDADETSAMPANPGAGSFSDFWYSVHIEYEVGSISNLTADDGEFMRFKSYLSENTNIEDPVDEDSSDVDNSADVGFYTNFTYQQLGPDSQYDQLSEQYFGNLTIDYVDNNSSDVDSSEGIGTHSGFPNQQSGPDAVYDLLKEEKVPETADWGITSSSFSFNFNPSNYRYMGGTSPNIMNMTVTKLYVRTTGAGTVAVALYTGGALDDPTGAVKRTEAYNVAVSAGWNEIDVPDYQWAANTVTWIGFAMNTGIYYSTSSGDAGDFQTARGRWSQTNPGDADETSAMPANPGAGSFGNFWYTVYAEYETTSNQLDLEAQWTSVSEYYEGTEVAIRTGAFNGSEQLQLDIWNSSSQWQTLGYLAADSWNNFTLGPYLASSNVTVRFKGADEASDAVKDTWQIDASLIRLLGKRNYNDPVDNDSSDIDSSPDIGVHSDFTAQQSGPDSTYDVLTEEDTVGVDYDTTISSFSPDYRWELDGDETDSIDSLDSNGGTDPSWVSNIIPEASGTQCADYDGSSSVSQLPGASDINTGTTTQKSISFWFIADTIDTSGNGRIIWEEGATYYGIGVYLSDDNGTDCIWVCIGWNNGATLDYCNAKVNTGVLYHCVVVCDFTNTYMAIYLNGTLATSNTISGGTSFNSHASDPAIGGPDSGPRNHNSLTLSGYFDGRLADVVYYAETTCLTKENATAIYEAGIGAGESNYELDLEMQWTGLVYDIPNEELCIYAGSMGAEDLIVEVWNTTASGWNALFSDLTASSWNNISITDYLTSDTLTLRFKGSNETGDSVQDQWEIDIALIHAWRNGTAEYSLDMEYQWTAVDFTEASEELCIYGGTMGAENILVDVWHDDAWNNVFADLSPGWNNVSVTQYLNSSTFTIRVRDANPTSDAVFDTWEIDVSLLHLWGETYTAEVEFEGTSNLYEWPQIEWTVDSAWTNASIRVDIRLYNYSGDAYPESGNGFSNYTSGPAGIDETESQVITDSPMDFRNTTSGWKIKVRGEHTSQFDLSVDYIALNTTYYDEYTAQTEFVFTDVTDNLSPNLNFTVVNHNSIDGATVTLQVWNYTASSFPSSGQGYLSYVSTGANNTRWVNVTNNAQSCLSGSYARIRVTSVYSTTDYYQQFTNFVRLLQEESILVNDYALRVINNGTALYTIRLVRVSDSNIDRIINCTIYFRSGETQLQVVDGAFTLTTGTWANLPAASSLDILIDASTIHLQYASVIETELEVLRSGTSTYTKYPIQFTIT